MTEHLSDQQMARLEAVERSVGLLGRKSEGAFKAMTHPDVTDLVDLAEYIMSGVHPMERYGDALNVHDA